MERVMALSCQHCGKGVNSLERKAKHERVCGLGAPTTDGSHTRSHSTSESHKCDQPSVTEQNPNPITDLAVTQVPESHSVTGSTSSFPSEVKGVTRVTECDPDPLTEIRNAVGYLNARRDYLNRWELGFVGSMAFILSSKTNGDRARSITPDMVGKLFETRAKVEALEERDKREAEYDRVQRHFSDMKQPGHVWCDLCTKDKRERDEAKATWESAMAEQDAVIEETRLRKERERLEAARTGDRPRPAMKPWVMAQKRLAARKAVAPGAKNEGATDAR